MRRISFAVPIASSVLETTCAARAVHVVGRFRLEQLGVREDDPQLVVQAVEEEPEFGKFIHRAPRQQFLHTERTRHHAWFRPSACHMACTAGRSALLASRQSVSTKMRTDPPAVRTYSILPLESQL